MLVGTIDRGVDADRPVQVTGRVRYGKQSGVDLVPGAVATEPLVPLPDRLPGPELLGQITPPRSCRDMDRNGLLVGSLLTAIPFGLIHRPLAFEGDGWAGTTWTQAFVNWAFLLGAVPFLRYLAGILLVDTRGSVLAVAVLHASFNASGALSVTPDGWQYVPALIVLTALVVVHRHLRGDSLIDGAIDDPASVPDNLAMAQEVQL